VKGSIAKSQKTNTPKTLMELAEQYCREIVLRPASRETYVSTARVFVRDTGINALGEITHEDVLAWRDAVIGRCSFTTWNSYRRNLKTLYNFAVRREWAAMNPFLEVKPLISSKRKKIVAKPVLVQALDFLRSESTPISPGWFWSAAFRLLFFSGMRRRQLTALRWRDLDFERETILLVIEGSKTRREWEIPMPPQCVDDLRELWRRARAKRRNLSDRQVFWVQLFDPRYGGTELTPDQVSNAFYRLSKHLGIKITAHRLRHTMATELAQGENPDLKSLQYLLGHSNLSVTLEYVHPEMAQLRLQQSKLRLE
jgi:integrase